MNVQAARQHTLKNCGTPTIRYGEENGDEHRLR